MCSPLKEEKKWDERLLETHVKRHILTVENGREELGKGGLCVQMYRIDSRRDRIYSNYAMHVHCVVAEAHVQRDEEGARTSVRSTIPRRLVMDALMYHGTKPMPTLPAFFYGNVRDHQ